MKWAFIFPGQGESHSVGMGRDFYDNFSVAKAAFEEASDLIQLDLKDLIFNGPLERLTETENCQIALYVTSMATLRVIQNEFPDLLPYVCGGLSLGEYSAATAAGFLPFTEGVKGVRLRGSLMQKACRMTKGTMAVVLGAERELVQKIVQERPGELWVANLNCPGQIVISGTFAGVEHFTQRAKELSIKRVLPLNVVGAYHSGLMQSAQEGLEEGFQSLQWTKGICPLVMNVTGQVEEAIEKIVPNLLKQVTHSVLWEDSIRVMDSMGVEGYLEIGCGKVLAGLNKRIGVKGPTLSINQVEDLQTLSKALTQEVKNG